MTLQDLIEAVHQLTDDDREAVAILTRLLASGRVRCRGLESSERFDH